MTMKIVMLQHSGYIKFKNRFCVPVQVQMYQTANFTKLKIESPSQANSGGSDLQICSQMPVEATSPWTWGQWPSALHGVPVQLPAYPVPISTAWWQRKQGVSNLPKVFTQQRPGQELNTHLHLQYWCPTICVSATLNFTKAAQQHYLLEIASSAGHFLNHAVL